jgi:hypothetical protein
MVNRKGLYALPSNLRLLTNASSPMSVGQRKPRGGGQILGRKIARYVYIYKRDYVSVTLQCHIYDLAMRKI